MQSPDFPPACPALIRCRRGRRTVIRTLTTVLLLPALPLSAQARVALATAINDTARFRALSQRTAKIYGQMVLKVRPDSSGAVMEHTRQQIRAGFETVGGQSWPPEVLRLLADLRHSADRLDTLVAKAPTKESFQAVSAQADQMLTIANTTVEALERLALAPTARLVNMAGRQRMLSQRLAKNYELIAAGMDARALRQQVASDGDEFQRAMDKLGQAPISTPAIRFALEQGQGQWVFFQSALKRPPDARGLDDVATTSERLLEVMDNLTGLYEAALRDVLG